MGYIRKYKPVPKHFQVPFETIDGKWVDVDEGMFDILILLRELGVRTRYSCQGDEFSAYVMGSGRDFARLTRKIKRLYHKGRYPMDVLETVNQFMAGYRKYELAKFDDHGSGRKWQVELKFGNKNPRQSYAYERSYSREYGNRTTVRWPKGETLLVKDLLEETLRA